MSFETNHNFSHSIGELSRLISRPEREDHVEEKYGQDCNKRLYCLASIPVCILKGLREELKDLFNVIEKTSRCARFLIKGLCDDTSKDAYVFAEEGKEHCWQEFSDAGIKAVDCLGASVIRPFSVVSDAFKYLLGIIEPSAALRPFSYDEDEQLI